MPDKQGYLPQGISNSTQALADVMPNGKVFDAKNIGSSTFRKFLKGLAQEQVRYESSLFELISQYIPNFTTSYIEEWERELGIPDECFLVAGQTDLERRRNIIIKLAFLGLVTAQDYLNLAAVLGLTIEISAADNPRFPLVFPVLFGAAYTITIIFEGIEESGFPYTFPITFVNQLAGLYECLANKYKQAYVEIEFEYDTTVSTSPLTDGNGETIVSGDGNAIFTPIL